MYRSGCAAGCCLEDGGSNPLGRRPKRTMRRKCGSGDGAAAGVLCLVLAFLVPMGTFLSVSKNLDIPHTEDKNYEDETRHPSTGGTDGGAGC